MLTRSLIVALIVSSLGCTTVDDGNTGNGADVSVWPEEYALVNAVDRFLAERNLPAKGTVVEVEYDGRNRCKVILTYNKDQPWVSGPTGSRYYFEKKAGEWTMTGSSHSSSWIHLTPLAESINEDYQNKAKKIEGRPSGQP